MAPFLAVFIQAVLDVKEAQNPLLHPPEFTVVLRKVNRDSKLITQNTHPLFVVLSPTKTNETVAYAVWDSNKVAKHAKDVENRMFLWGFKDLNVRDTPRPSRFMECG